MCIVHDFGEAITGDIPSFYKTHDNEIEEEKAVEELISVLPVEIRRELSDLFSEMAELKTPEAKLFKSLDNMEALVSHNEAPIFTWLPLEYEENLIYGKKNVDWSEWTRLLREEINKDSVEKIKKEGVRNE